MYVCVYVRLVADVMPQLLHMEDRDLALLNCQLLGSLFAICARREEQPLSMGTLTPKAVCDCLCWQLGHQLVAPALADQVSPCQTIESGDFLGH
jgi:hypothetical protein